MNQTQLTPGHPAPWSLSSGSLPHRFLAATLLILLVSAFSHATYGIISENNHILFYLVAVIITALYLGRGPALWAALANFFMLDLGVLHPRFQFGYWDAQYLISLAAFLVTGNIISSLADSVRRQAWEASSRERRTAALYDFSRELARQGNRQEVADLVSRHALQACALHVQIEWDPNSQGIPIRGPRSQFGVAHCTPPPSGDSATFLEALLNQGALALEQFELSEQARKASLLEATEKLQSALLNSISHDLQTPLASISGTIQVLRDATVQLSEKDRMALLELAGEESTRLRRLVDNVLNLSRLEGGALQLHPSPANVEDLLSTVISQSPADSRPRLKLEVEEDLPEISIDYILMSQVLLNLVENACKYSPSGSPVELGAHRNGSLVYLEVSDVGPGIPDDEREKCFERFYRGAGFVTSPGSGLGLSICRGVVEAHQGKIWVQPSKSRGSCFVVALPAFDRAEEPSSSPEMACGKA